jgi:hypothetical protein
MPNASLRRLILVPALVTLAITLLRLTGELLQWSPRLFDRSAGGGAALIGIVWLIPVFGAWFALQLQKAGQAPAGLKRAFGRAGLAFLCATAGFVLAILILPKSPVGQLALFTVVTIAAIVIARPGWPELWRVLLAYGVAARLPVLVIMFLSIFLGWDTHYAKPRPDFPPMGPWGLFFWTALLPQGSIWIYLTIVGGMLFGAAAVAIRRKTRAGTAAEARGAA